MSEDSEFKKGTIMEEPDEFSKPPEIYKTEGDYTEKLLNQINKNKNIAPGAE